MPQYLFGNQSNTSNTSGCAEPCETSITFFSNLSEKMLAMVESLKKQFEECKNKIPQPGGRGFFLAKITTTSGAMGIKQEYMEYIKRYGPPLNGKFDETLLQKLRDELGISTASYTI